MSDKTHMQEFLRLFTSHELRLRAFAMTLVANYADAEDVLQEANLVMWERFEQFQPGTKFMSWAGRVVYLEAMEHRRKALRSKVRFGEDFFKAIATVALRDDVAADMGEHEHALGECIAKLKPEHQDILRARYADGIGVEQLSSMFHRSVEAIYQVLSRTRKVLHDCVNHKIRREALHGR
jgi:RNA polymerase sigma-70 factor (ECF subfamily)